MIIVGFNSVDVIKKVLTEQSLSKPLIVAGKSFSNQQLNEELRNEGIKYILFSDFSPNPKYEEVVIGVNSFNINNCDSIIAIGGGSAIDVAKCIKLFSKMNLRKPLLSQKYFDTGIMLIAVPTTAGTGSESTRFSVIYMNGVKQSIHHDSILPNYAVLDARLLDSLPVYQKKCTLLDAFCQAIESYWSINSTNESKKFACSAIRLIVENYHEYIFDYNTRIGEKILIASNFSGQAINITQTTAAHAMSYKITTMYGIPHGHAVAISLPYIWEYMLSAEAICVDKRGSDYLKSMFYDLSMCMGKTSPLEAIDYFKGILDELKISPPIRKNEIDINTLVESVNIERLNNSPVKLDKTNLEKLYNLIIG